MTREELRKELLKQHYAGNLITDKHDPTKLGTKVYEEPRSVLSLEMLQDIETFLLSDEWDAVQYSHIDPRNDPIVTIVPHPSSGFSVPASGVASWDTTPSTDCDLLVTVSGQVQGWHIYGESSATINQKVSDGTLFVLGSLD